MKTMTLTFEHFKETKTTHRYNELGDNPKIGSLYVKKHAIGEIVPNVLTVTIENGDK